MKKIFLILFIFLFLGIGNEVLSIWRILDVPPSTVGRISITDRYGKIFALLPKDGGYSKSYTGAFDNKLIENIITTEDRRFFSHHGVDIVGKIGALRENYNAGDIVRGGSTITEQYIKNTYFPKASRTLTQKGKEAFWSIILEIKYTKEEVLRKYLDSVYMGNGIYGIGSALEVYFAGVEPENLTDSDILNILTRIKYPNLTEGSRKYMETLAEKRNLEIGGTPLMSGSRPIFVDIFPLLTKRIESEVNNYCDGKQSKIEAFLKSIPKDLCLKNDITLISSIDMEMSLEARNTLEGIIFPLESKNVHNGSILVWSEKEKKYIIYIGNRANGRENAIDMITRKRSVGSTLKPFIYGMLLEKGADPNMFILDETRVYETANAGKVFVSENYIPKSYGPVTLGEGLGNSLNSATVRLSEYLGIGRIYDRFRTLGFEMDHESGYYGYGISLGSVELSLENILEGYRHLSDLSDINNFLIFDILSSNKNRAKTFGVSSILNTSLPLAVKTGTSTEFRDNWAIGYDENILIGVWVGNTDNESMDDVSGITGAGPLYHSIAEMLISRGYITPKIRTMPSGLKNDFICLDMNCMQKTLSYSKEGWSRKSRPISSMYYSEDFATPMTDEERKKWKIK